MILIKLGGSVITDKKEYRKFNTETVSRLCKEIKDSGEDVIIVHGAGSFGHILAKKYDLNGGYVNDEQISAMAEVCYDVRELNSYIISELNRNGMPAISVPPGSCFIMDDRELIIESDEVIKGFVGLGIMPVLFGDVVLDRKLGFSICSGDQIMEKLGNILDIEKVIFVSDIDGLFDSDPKNNPDAKLYRDVNEKILESVKKETSVDDVTGGVVEKMKSMLRLCNGDRECILINGNVEGRLLSLLKNEDVICTRARGA